MPVIARFAPSNKHLSSLALLERRVIWPCDDLFLSLVGQIKYSAPSDAVHRSQARSNKHLSSLAILERRVIWPCDDLFLILVGQRSAPPPNQKDIT